MTATEPRGIRNHNPGNLRAGDPWQGLGDPPADADGFCRFAAPAYGIRAIARTLITYQDFRRAGDGSRIDTVAEIVGRWAPPGENDTDAYVRAVRRAMGIAPGRTVDVHRYDVARPLVEAIIRHENGCQPYSDAQIDKGLVLAGIEPPARSLRHSRTVKGGQLAGAGGAAATALGLLGQAAPALPVLDWLRDNFTLALIVLGLAVLGGVGWMIWARIDDRERGLR